MLGWEAGSFGTQLAQALVAVLPSAGYLLPRVANDPSWLLSPDLPRGIKIRRYLLCLTRSGPQTPTPQ